MLRPTITRSLNGSKAFTLEQKGNDQEKLEMLLYEKAQRGEDVSQILQALNYFRNTNNEEYWLKIFKRQTQEKLTFESLQRVIITAFAILGIIVFFAKVQNPSSNILKQSHSNSIQKQITPHSLHPTPNLGKSFDNSFGKVHEIC
ncbi:hypothetical protein A6770_32410 [Nostoc minutum NIES-26]|uniref:Uncharacterized protein n=1 Tax=Nostoc minutum NIES-26 TaxID=1844469 RepID=A0A367Q4V9_9NOSO|nr:hypothetical protein A6770_32410 [Nostoc minutum NIES-26]